MEDKEPIHEMFKDSFHEGLTFGADRWITTLQRMCERFNALVEPTKSSLDLKGGNLKGF